MSEDVEQLTDPIAEHGEGPVWDWRENTLRWVDMLRGDILSLALDGTTSRRHVGSIAAAWRPRRSGGAVVAVERGFALLDDDADHAPHDLPEIWSDPTIRMNDGACDPQGRFYCGSTATDGRPHAARLFRLDVDLTVHAVLVDVSVSNGLAWSPDGSSVYYVDTPTNRVDVFDFDAPSGAFGRRRRFARVPDGAGLPDGITVDAEGGVWVACWGGGRVLRYGEQGTLDHRIDMPVSNPTACTFGGQDLDQLYITTSAFGLSTQDEPAAGSLFAVRPGVGGLPVAMFDG